MTEGAPPRPVQKRAGAQTERAGADRTRGGEGSCRKTSASAAAFPLLPWENSVVLRRPGSCAYSSVGPGRSVIHEKKALGGKG